MRNIPLRYTLPEVRTLLGERGLVLLSSEYQSNRLKLDLQCACGTLFKASLGAILSSGTRECQSCSAKTIGAKKAFSLEFAQAEFIARGVKPLFTEYKNNAQDLQYECSTIGCSNVHKISLNNLRRGFNPHLRCPECSLKLSRRRGADHPQWSPELTAEERAAQGRPNEVYRWYSAVIRNAGYRCALTGARPVGSPSFIQLGGLPRPPIHSDKRGLYRPLGSHPISRRVWLR